MALLVSKNQRSRQHASIITSLLLFLTIIDFTYGFVRVMTPRTMAHTRSFSSSSSLHATTYKKVFVAGGSKGVGRCIIDQLCKEGIDVVALVRNADVAAELNSINGVTAIVGDAFVIKDVENAMDGCDAAISTLGGTPIDDAENRIDYIGNNHVIESAGILGVTRVILVTSIGCGSSKDATPPATYNVLKNVLLAKEKAENILIKYYTNTNWTIIRPGGLKSEPMTNKAILTSDSSVIGTIHREDVARLVVEALKSANTERKILSAIDPSLKGPVTSVATSADTANELTAAKPIEAFVL